MVKRNVTLTRGKQQSQQLCIQYCVIINFNQLGNFASIQLSQRLSVLLLFHSAQLSAISVNIMSLPAECQSTDTQRKKYKSLPGKNRLKPCCSTNFIFKHTSYLGHCCCYQDSCLPARSQTVSNCDLSIAQHQSWFHMKGMAWGMVLFTLIRWRLEVCPKYATVQLSPTPPLLAPFSLLPFLLCHLLQKQNKMVFKMIQTDFYYMRISHLVANFMTKPSRKMAQSLSEENYKTIEVKWPNIASDKQ